MAWLELGEDASSPHEQHLINVYNDADFHKELDAIFPEHAAFARKFYSIGGTTKRRLAQQLKDAKPELDVLAAKYRITPHEMDYFMTGQYYHKGLIPKEDAFRTELVVNRHGQFTAYFDTTVTKQQILELWDLVSQYKQEASGDKTSRNKLPANDKLIYAIFKAKMSPKKPTFLQIYWQYQKDELAGYDDEQGVETKKFMSAEALEKYYRRNQPRLKTDT